MIKIFAVLFSLVLLGCPTTPTQKIDIEKTMHSRTNDFRRCYESERMPAGAAGKVVTDFAILTDGKTSGAKVVSTTLNQPKVEACLLRTIEGMRFSVPQGTSEVHVTYPFHFSGHK